MTNDTSVGFGNLWFSKRGTKGVVVVGVVLVGFNRSLNKKNNKSLRFMDRGLLNFNFTISLKMIPMLGLNSRRIY